MSTRKRQGRESREVERGAQRDEASSGGMSGNGADSAFPASVRHAFEPVFHHSFANVRVHNDARASELTQREDAAALAIGPDIHFADGAWDPESTKGRLLLAHELAHVVQYERSNSGEVRDAPNDDVPALGTLRRESRESSIEDEAWSAGLAAIRGESVDISQSTSAESVAAADRGFLERAWGALSQEGLGAIADPFGAYDRQRSQDVLSDHLQVVGDDFVGPHKPNQVSQQEFEQQARTYSNINLGRGDLTIDPRGLAGTDADDYKSGVMRNLATMMETNVGRQEIDGLSNNVMKDDAGNVRHGIGGIELPFDFLPAMSHQSTIEPFYKDANGDGDQWNDPTGKANFDMTNAMAIWARGKNSGDAFRDASGARGAGTNTNILFNPGIVMGPGSPDDVVLAHEMSHALHETQGDMASGTVTAASGIPADVTAGISSFEHQAAGLGLFAGDPLTENAYRRERRMNGAAMPLRTNYSGAMP